MAAINNLLSLEIIKNISLAETHVETLPSGPQWLWKDLPTEFPTKQPAHLFYCNPIECLQALLSHLLFNSHISFVPRRVWTNAAKICHIYDEWLSGDHAWTMQEALLPGATLLGVVLSSDIVHSLLQDQLVHQAINIVLSPLKTAVAVGVMMSDLRGNLSAWIADTPEEGLLAGTGQKASPVTTATLKSFGDIAQYLPMDYKNFLKAAKQLHLNGVMKPCWNAWALSNPSEFLTLEVLYHFHCIWLRYQVFNEEVSKLKQVTRCDHHSSQHYITGIVAVPLFTTKSIERVATSLQEFHNHKLELLQSVVSSICPLDAIMQWSANITEHVHVKEIKILALTYIEECADQLVDEDNDFFDSREDDEHGPDTEKDHFSGLSTLVCQIPNYFAISLALLLGMKLIDETATLYEIYDLHSAVTAFVTSEDICLQVPSPHINRLQIWHKVCMQQMSYHNNSILLSPQTLCATPPLTAHPHGQYDSVIIHIMQLDCIL
ncbi:hypothetical protein V8B97DRAFT_2023552 [Scleroderma yunnanense]